MVYSYYESVLFRLTKEANVKSSTPSCIASSLNAILEDEYLQISKFLHETIRPLRNELCHNNNGTLFEKRKKEERDNIEKLILNKKISIYENRITVIDREFIRDVLNREHKLLIRLSKICNYNATFVASKQ